MKILIIDDNDQFSMSLIRMLEDGRYSVLSALNGEDGLKIIKNEKINIVLLDIRLSDESGIDVLLSIKKISPDLPVIMLTGYASIESAVNSIKMGAFDYLQKPIKYEKLVNVIENAASISVLKEENRNLVSRLDELKPKMISRDPVVLDMFATVKKLSDSKIAFLITGENGIGKEVLADYIHSQSKRCYNQFLKVNCAAFPENLLDNELFGHDKGAFTGASSMYKGVFERAHEGTLFLDEIGDMSLNVQAKVLRVLQNGELYRLGGKNKIYVDIQFISATNKNLKELICRGLFREDLYYRLNAATLVIPPLRERPYDIPLLAEHFLLECNNENRKIIKGFCPEVMHLFLKYSWPGNIRELKNTIFFASAICQGSRITIQDLPASFNIGSESFRNDDVLKLSEKNLILKELERFKYNKKKVAESLNISRSTLYSKMRKHEIFE